jgi:hypothetical protein
VWFWGCENGNGRYTIVFTNVLACARITDSGMRESVSVWELYNTSRKTVCRAIENPNYLTYTARKLVSVDGIVPTSFKSMQERVVKCRKMYGRKKKM